MSAPTWDTKPATVAETLSRVRELLAVEERWTQGAVARDASGADCAFKAARACRWCLFGAVLLVTRGTRLTPVWDWLCEFIAGDLSPAGFNDCRTHAQVLDLLDRALTGARRAGI